MTTTIAKPPMSRLRKYYPLIILSLCSSLLFYKYILNVSPSIMVPDLMRQFQVTGAQLGSLSATFFYTYTVVQLFSGVLLDKLGARFIAGFSTLIAALGAYLFSQADVLWVATLARCMMGFGVAFATVTYFKLSIAWFRVDQLAFVGGLLATAVMIGAVFGQAPLAWVVQQTSWRFALQCCSILGLVIAILFLILGREKPKSSLNPITERTSATAVKIGWREIKSTLKNKQNWYLTLYSGLVFAPLSAIGGLWGNPFLQETHHLTNTQAAGLTSLLFIGLGLGSPLLGLISDKLGNRLSVMKCGALISLVSLLVAVYFPDLPLWLLGFLLFSLGFSTGAFMLGFTLGTQINPMILAGTTVALINTGDSVLESVTEPLLGKILDLNWSGQLLNGTHHFTAHDYRVAFSPLIIYVLIGLSVLYLMKEPKNFRYS